MQQLPAKDQAVFRSIVKFYETKQYKKGIKAADSILKKHPDHGETLCMKGLTLSYLEKKEEAYELVRKGLKHDLRSHVCWHVFGLLYRQDRDYYEAVKCYRQALRIDPDNLQILRDLSLLQIHSRDLPGFAETRRKLLQNKPQHRLNWLGYAIAEHLCKSFEFAWTCLDNYENTFKDEDVPAYEVSELFLYKAAIMEEAGKFEEALECLKQHEKQIVDKLGFLEAKARLLMYLGRSAEASEVYAQLIKKNPEDHRYILCHMANLAKFQRFWPALPAPAIADAEGDGEKMAEGNIPRTISSFPDTIHPLGTPIWGWPEPQKTVKPNKRVAIGTRLHKRRMDPYEPAVKLTPEDEEEVQKHFEELQAQHPKCDAMKRVLLHFITGDRFKQKLDEYLRPRIRRGIPSLFRMMRPFYFQNGKVEVIEKLLLQYAESLQKEIPTFGPWVKENSDELKEEPPTCYLFTLMVLSEHFDFLGQSTNALEYCDKAVEHTPTLVELYTCKAKLYRHAGDLKASAQVYEEVRSMDLADRYLNCVCVKAMLRLDDTQGGMEKALLFSKEPDSQESANLHDMQCMWYESAVGRSYVRQRKYGRALKMFSETFKHFSDIAEDQFDFHNYCLRKTTLKAYVGMLRMQERLYSHKFYRRAAKDAINIYIELFDMKARGEALPGTSTEGNDGGEMSAAEKKRMKHKARREAKATEKDSKANQGAAAGGKAKKVDDDPEGKKLLEKDYMEEANKIVKKLVVNCSSEVATHTLTYDVAARQGKLLHCLQAIIRLWEIADKDTMYYKLAAPLSHFCFVADLERKDMPDAVRVVVLSEIAPVLGSDQPFADVATLRLAATKIVDEVEKRVRQTPEMPVAEVLHYLKCMKHAGRDCKSFLEEEWHPKGAFALKECEKMLRYLETEYGIDSVAREQFKKRCLELFPLMVST